jgi:hypothetical protein
LCNPDRKILYVDMAVIDKAKEENKGAQQSLVVLLLPSADL